MISEKTSKLFNYALLTFLILWSGGGFTYGLFPYWMVYAFLFVGCVFYSKQFTFTPSNWGVLGLLVVVLGLQFIKFNGAPISIVSPVLVITICMMTSFIIRDQFSTIFVNIIYFFAISSLFLWSINIIPAGHAAIGRIANGLPQLGWDNLSNLETNSVNNAKSIYLFTITDAESFLPRNYGPFWEPGRFTIYLTLSLAINLFHNGEKITSIKNLTFLCANITTFSTTGYSALAIIMMAWVTGNRDYSILKKTFLIGLLAIAATYVWQLDFMAEKINEQANQTELSFSRFGAMVYHWTQIIQSPIIGYGPYLSTHFIDLYTSPNGLTDLLRYYGIPASILLYALLFKSTSAYIGENYHYRIGVFFALLVLCFSQTITYAPFFYLLYFLGLNNTLQDETY